VGHGGSADGAAPQRILERGFDLGRIVAVEQLAGGPDPEVPSAYGQRGRDFWRAGTRAGGRAAQKRGRERASNVEREAGSARRWAEGEPLPPSQAVAGEVEGGGASSTLSCSRRRRRTGRA
jgi:hypothetical protein